MQSACIIYVNKIFAPILHVWEKPQKPLVCYNFVRTLKKKKKKGGVLQVACKSAWHIYT